MLINDLKHKSARVRSTVAEMCIERGGHIASSLSCIEILVALYQGGTLNISKDTLDHPDRDRFILSKGHGETVLYAILADMGFFPNEWLSEQYRYGDCILGGHPDKNIPGVEHSTGSLGHGLGVACGLATAGKIDNSSRYHYVLLGDAECTEGSVWEACLYASAQNLDNVIAIVDRNHIGSIDFIDSFTSLKPFAEKWSSFGWNVFNCNGHDFAELFTEFEKTKNMKNGKPSVVIAETVKGKGISFIEHQPIWHVKQLNNSDDIDNARKELSIGEGND